MCLQVLMYLLIIMIFIIMRNVGFSLANLIGPLIILLLIANIIFHNAENIEKNVEEGFSYSELYKTSNLKNI